MKQISLDAKYVRTSTEALDEIDGCLVMTVWSEYAKLNNTFDDMKIYYIIDGKDIFTIPDAEEKYS